ncbi:MAG TPA: DUF2059 domain-containing protein [Longimicrobium sp.]|jgi:hypothetical protein
MKKITVLVPALLAVLLAAGPAAAQPAPVSPTHRAAALELLEAMRVSEALQLSIETVLQAQMQSNPELQAVESVMRDFFVRYMSWDNLKAGYADIYSRAFTEPELREMIAFYRTPTGQKLARATPQLMREGSELGQRAVQEHMGELQEAVLRQLSGPPAPPPPAPAPPPPRP